MSAAKNDPKKRGPKKTGIAQLLSLRGTTLTQKLSILAGGASTGGAFAVDHTASHPMLVGGLAVLVGFLFARLVRWFVGWVITVIVVVVGLIVGMSYLGWLPDAWTTEGISTALVSWWGGATEGLAEAADELMPGSGGGGLGVFAGLKRSKPDSDAA